MIDNGLTYRRSYIDNETVLIYGPTSGFTVDDIFYVPNPNLYSHRPMIEVFDDCGLGFDGGIPHLHSLPPLTDAQLDQWVAEGWIRS